MKIFYSGWASYQEPFVFSVSSLYFQIFTVKLIFGQKGGGRVWRRCHVFCIQLILAHISARPALLVAGKGRGGMFLFVRFHSCSSFFPVLFHLWGWSGVAMVSCTLHHRGIHLILAYSWERPAILVAGEGRGVMFLFLLFLHCHSCSSFFPVPLFHLLYYYLFSPFLWETTQNDPQGLMCR